MLAACVFVGMCLRVLVAGQRLHRMAKRPWTLPKKKKNWQWCPFLRNTNDMNSLNEDSASKRARER